MSEWRTKVWRVVQTCGWNLVLSLQKTNSNQSIFNHVYGSRPFHKTHLSKRSDTKITRDHEDKTIAKLNLWWQDRIQASLFFFSNLQFIYFSVCVSNAFILYGFIFLNFGLFHGKLVVSAPGVTVSLLLTRHISCRLSRAWHGHAQRASCHRRSQCAYHDRRCLASAAAGYTCWRLCDR